MRSLARKGFGSGALAVPPRWRLGKSVIIYLFFAIIFLQSWLFFRGNPPEMAALKEEKRNIAYAAR